ncbi:hypothetical protein AL036_09125 [Salipiger aestuarii]|uniref:choice-of-anchor E domain-containing protein n=1 Tax=Salipiger aestuarii TaxID=568098 RepID=UPI00025B6456|nr:choice-of-anchor E domain-containing protein [Salipiger aestuarii]EIE51286.1 hypothetical protein C357_09563 [Citreicella sp. 357]KAA8607932.1 hypothetical protein AL036_09125 [Salipiger aestuarii]KAA8611163.1 hypothetical protein AL037_10085 [Salipiger aestuarii]
MKYLITAVATSVMLASSANALTLSYQDTITDTGTPWLETLKLGKFDSSLGALNSVTLSLSGISTGSVGIERNTRALDIDLTYVYNLGANIYASVAGVAELNVEILPVSNRFFVLGPYDGVRDYAGQSGTTYDGFYGTDADAATITSNFAPFLGTDTFDVAVLAIGTSSVEGATNYWAEVSGTATATASVIYDYTPTAVPLPAGAPLLLLGVGGIAMLRRRKKA